MTNVPNDYSGSSDSGGLITEQVKQGTQQVVQQTQQAAGEAIEQAKGQATGMLQSRKSQMTDSLTSAAKALRQTGESLRTQQQEPVANVTDGVAQRIEGIASYFDRRDIGQLISDAERYARRNPIVVLGGSFLLGVAAARFLKSSTQPSGNQNDLGAYGSYGRYGGGAHDVDYTRQPSGGRYNSNYGSMDSGYDSGYTPYAPGLRDTSGIRDYSSGSEFAPSERYETTGALGREIPSAATDTFAETEAETEMGMRDGTASRVR